MAKKESASAKKARQLAEAKARSAANTAKKAGSSSSSKSSSKDEKKAVKRTKEYYTQNVKDTKAKAATDTTRLQEDLTKIMAESGLASNRATEDYIRNIGNIEANKSNDVTQLNDYVTTNRGRTQEDLSTSLAKEARRYSLESDQINQNLADKGLTFSERNPEKIAQVGTAQNIADITQTADRSFADIARYETAKNADIQLKYGQQTEAATTGKTRTLEDILNEQQAAATKINRTSADVATALPIDVRNLNFASNDAVSQIGNYYDTQDNQLSTQAKKFSVLGT